MRVTSPMRAAAEPAQASLGARLRALRVGHGLSLRALADRAGVTFGALSQIENDHSSPSVATLKKILAALGSTLGEFFVAAEGPQRDPGFVFRARDLVDVSGGAGVKYLSLPGQTRARAMQLLWEVYRPGKGTGAEEYAHAGEEGGFCISGSIELVVDGRTERLGPGDAYYFDSSLPHIFRNPGTTPAVVVSACTPPSF